MFCTARYAFSVYTTMVGFGFASIPAALPHVGEVQVFMVISTSTLYLSRSLWVGLLSCILRLTSDDVPTPLDGHKWLGDMCTRLLVNHRPAAFLVCGCVRLLVSVCVCL